MQPPPQNQPSTERNRADIFSFLIIAAAAIYMSVSVGNSDPLQSANDRSRWCTVWSLVERGTYRIDEIDQVQQWSTIDKVRHRESDSEPWHFYSSKPPLFPTMVAGLYWLEKHTLGYDLFTETATVTRLLLLIINVLPIVLALLAFGKSLRLLNVSASARRVLLATAGFATMLNPFLTTLNNHTPGAVSLIFSLAAIVRLRESDQPKPADFAFVGFFAALTCCFELPAALFGVLSFLFVVSIDWRRTAKYYVPAAVIPLAAFFITNWICTGGIKPFYTYYGTEKYVFVHEGVPSYWAEPQGIDANQESPLVYLFHCVLGHHGIVSLTPMFLLTIAGWFFAVKAGRKRSDWPVMWMGIVISAAVLTFYLTRTENYNYGGNSSALRWVLWLTPFWLYGMVPAVERALMSKKRVLLVAILWSASVYSSAYSLQRPWKPSWLYTRMQNAGWIDYGTRVLPFDPPRYSLLSNLPTESGVTNTFVGTLDAAGQSVEFKTDQEAAANDGAQPLTVTLAGQSDSPRSVQLLVEVGQFAAGTDVTQWLRSSDGTAGAPKWAAQLLRGLPSARPYNSASPRYLKYVTADGEKTAVKCDRGAARVAFQHPEFGKCWHRCDVYYCDEVPFGVAQWKITVTQATTNKVVRRELWTCQQLPE